MLESIADQETERKSLKTIKSILINQSIVITAFFYLAIIYTLYFGGALLVPILLAFLLYFLTIPIVNFLSKKCHIPAAIGSALVILAVLVIVAYGFYSISRQAQEWTNKGPEIINDLIHKVNTITSVLKRPMEILASISQDIENALNLSVNPEEPTNVFGSVFKNAWTFLIGFFTMLVFLYFLLASKNFFLIKIIKILLHQKRRQEAEAVVRQIEKEIWHFLFIRTMTNVGVAIIVSLMLWAFGLPNPILWGIMAGALEFIPFIGAFISTIVILFISLLSFEEPLQILLPPITFFIFISLEGNLFLPYILGRGMTLNKVAVIFAIFFFSFIWGVMGSFLTVPIIMAIKIIMSNIREDNVINQLLEE